MCGIAGYFCRSGCDASNRTKIDRIVSKMSHRGPDDQQSLGFDCGYLGISRLSIVGGDQGVQPIQSFCGRFAVVMNGEIYNHLELRSFLKGKGIRFSTQSDAEVLLGLYELFGIKALSYLDGMYGFALFDRLKRRVWLARDRFGIKPLYYIFDGDSLCFSSEINALKSECAWSLDGSGLADYLSLGFSPGQSTLVAEIKALCPGESLFLDINTWESEFFTNLGNQASKSYASCELSEGVLIDLLKSSITSQGDYAGSLGCFLSGGLDSGVVFGELADKHKNDLNAYTVGFEGKADDELQRARQLAHLKHVKLREIKVTRSSFVSEFASMVRAMDTPFADSSCLPTYLVSKRAKEDGIRVLYSGAGGDELLGGYRRYYNGISVAPTYLSERRWPRFFATLFSQVLAPSYHYRISSPELNYASMISGINYAYASSYVSKDLLNIAMSGLRAQFTGCVDNQEKKIEFDFKSYLPQNILLFTDQMSMASSVEVRVPFLSEPFAQAVQQLSLSSTRFRMDINKPLLRQIYSSHYGAQMLPQKKIGFNMPISEWGGSKVMESLFSNGFSQVLIDVVIGDLDKFLWYVQHPRKNEGQTIFSLAVLNQWLLDKFR